MKRKVTQMKAVLFTAVFIAFCIGFPVTALAQTHFLKQDGISSSSVYGAFIPARNCQIRIVVAAKYTDGSTGNLTFKVGSKSYNVIADGTARVIGTQTVTGSYGHVTD